MVMGEKGRKGEAEREGIGKGEGTKGKKQLLRPRFASVLTSEMTHH